MSTMSACSWTWKRKSTRRTGISRSITLLCNAVTALYFVNSGYAQELDCFVQTFIAGI